MNIANQHQPESKAPAGSAPEKNTTSVDIQNTTYRMLANKAEDRGLSTRKYINDLLYLLVKKGDFIRKYVPDIYLDTTGANSIYLKDHRNKEETKTAEISIKDNKIYCSLDEAFDCVHIHFAYCLPEISILLRDEEQLKGIEEIDKEEKEEDNNNNHNKLSSRDSKIKQGVIATIPCSILSLTFLITLTAVSILSHHSHHILTHLVS